MIRISALTISAVILAAVLLAGCGGGGGDDNRVGEISGTVSDIAGNYIPGATVEVLEQGQRTKSLFNGVYKLTNVEPEWVTVKATATVDGEAWLGYAVVNVYDDGPTQSMNIVMGPMSQLGEFRGSVVNTAGDPLENARVYAVAKYPDDSIAENSSFVSIVAFTDSNGEYSLTDVPSKIRINGTDQSLQYRLVASYAGEEGMPVGFNNDEQTSIINSTTGYTEVNFVLSASSNVKVPTPAAWTLDVTSYTLPDDILTRGPGAYDAIRAHMSKSFASMLRANKGVRRSPPPGSLIEIDVSWQESWTAFLDDNFSGSVPANLAGFGIYRRVGSAPAVRDSDQLDFVRDPYLMYYGDTSSTLTVGQSYYYGVTTVSTSYLDRYNNFNPNAESALSQTDFVVPMNQVQESSPLNSASLTTGTVTFSWRAQSDAGSYQVLLYSGYPVVDNLYGDLPDHVPPYKESTITTGTSVQYPSNFSETTPLAPGTYYWVVVASSRTAMEGPAYSIGDLRSFTVR